jgi:hypothetical protein
MRAGNQTALNESVVNIDKEERSLSPGALKIKDLYDKYTKK